jgi:hypothetical protein
MNNIFIIQAQRYYHLVALKGSRSLLKKQFFIDWRINEVENFKVEKDFNLVQLSILTDTRYHAGEFDYSLNKDNKPPYKYDFILIENSKNDILILCLPFKNLMKNICFELELNYEILSQSNFLKVDMNKLIKSNTGHTDYIFKNNHFYFGGIFLSMAGDSYLSTVKLEGDKPLDSEIYKDYFINKINKLECKLEKCILKCSVELVQDSQISNARSSIHFDKYGNYKLYIHANGANLITIPALFDFLHDINCIIETPNNPVNYINSEEL